MDLAVLVALITALAAILAPLITANINRKSALELKSLEMIYSKKLDTYKEFAVNCGKVFESESCEDYQKLHSASYSVLLMADDVSNAEVKKIMSAVNQISPLAIDKDSLYESFESCMIALNNDLSRKQAKNKK